MLLFNLKKLSKGRECKSNSYCVGGRLYSSIINFYGFLSAKRIKISKILVVATKEKNRRQHFMLFLEQGA